MRQVRVAVPRVLGYQSVFWRGTILHTTDTTDPSDASDSDREAQQVCYHVFEVRVVVEHAFFVRHKKVSHFQVVALHHEHRTAPHRTPPLRKRADLVRRRSTD